MKKAVIVDGIRTPFLKAFSVPNLNARKLGVAPVRALISRHPDLVDLVDCVVGANVGNQLLPPDGSNIARLIALDAGIPQHVDARTININCGSGLEATIDAAMRVEVGLAKCVLVIGVEVMSDYTAVYPRHQRKSVLAKAYLENDRKMPAWKRAGLKLANRTSLAMMSHEPALMIKTGLTDPYCDLGMDKIGDALAKEFGISRKELDFFAFESQKRASKAQRSGRLAEEIVPVSKLSLADLMDHAAEAGFLDKDNGIRHDSTPERLERLSPLNLGGTATAGNASQVSDGAVALIIADEEFAAAQGWSPIVRVSSENSAVAGCDPTLMGLGPNAAVKRLFAKKGNGYWDLKNFGVIETNEAFASVPLAQSRLFEKEGLGPLPLERTNINGGAIAIGHPVGASGARLALTAGLELHHQDTDLALVMLCVGGGQGVATVLERCP